MMVVVVVVSGLGDWESDGGGRKKVKESRLDEIQVGMENVVK